MSSVDKVKIVALGASGTGKTSYLAGIFQQFLGRAYRSRKQESQDNRFRVELAKLTVENEDKTGFIQNLEDFTTLKKMFYSLEGTKFDETYEINLSVGDKNGSVVVPIELYDYKGGLSVINDVENNEQDIAKLLEELETADIIYILVDSTIAQQYGTGGRRRNEKIEEKLSINFFLNVLRYLISKDKDASRYIQFVFTKWDALDANRKNTAMQCVRELYADIIDLCGAQAENGTWLYDAKHVSLCGYNDSPSARVIHHGADELEEYVYEFIGEMHPEGLDRSFLGSIAKAMELRCVKREKARRDKERQIRKYNEMISCYNLGLKEKRRLHEKIIKIQETKDMDVKEHYNSSRVCSMIQDNVDFEVQEDVGYIL